MSQAPSAANGSGGEFPPLFYGEVDPQLVEVYRLCGNPEVGKSLTRPDYIPEGWGFSKLKDHHNPLVVQSFEADGIRNPVYLWQRWGRLWPRYGGSRCWFARTRKLPALRAIVADYEGTLGEGWEAVDRDEALSLFDLPPIGHTPHGWYDERGLEMAIELWHVRHGPS